LPLFGTMSNVTLAPSASELNPPSQQLRPLSLGNIKTAVKRRSRRQASGNLPSSWQVGLRPLPSILQSRSARLGSPLRMSARLIRRPGMAQPKSRIESLTGNVKREMRLRGSSPLLSLSNGQQDRVRRISRDDRSNFTLGDHARRRVAGARKA
jgi:hypothetical protein